MNRQIKNINKTNQNNLSFKLRLNINNKISLISYLWTNLKINSNNLH